MADIYEKLIARLDARACGGHPDGKVRQDNLARDAADAIILLRAQLAEAQAQERERCAQFAFDQQTDDPQVDDWNGACCFIATELRALSPTPNQET